MTDILCLIMERIIAECSIVEHHRKMLGRELQV